MNQIIHTTIGLYPNNTFKINGVKPEHLEEHIKYNKKNRFGRALFVDGKCIYKGIEISEENIQLHEQLFKADKYKMKAYSIQYQ